MDEDDSVVDFENIIQSMDEESNLVMGGIDNKALCTFTKGYMKRQAIYTCRTCLDIDKVRAGFCYPCAINCHNGHDLVELYTKRNFRCDCGNAKFAGSSNCLLWEEKDDFNDRNSYNINFSGLYCTCLRPYPDEELENDEEMIQCGICEDWFHVEHLNMGSDFVTPEEYEELNCFLCLQKFPFLCLYAFQKNENFRYRNMVLLNGNSVLNDASPPKRNRVDGTNQTNGQVDERPTCQLKQLMKEYSVTNPKDMFQHTSQLNTDDAGKVTSIFWPSNWRDDLCKCSDCQKMYRNLQLEFLLDPEDTMSFYLKLSKQKAEQIDEEETHALSEALAELPHPVALNVVTGVNRLKKALEEFLLKKRDENHVITESEVKAIFENLRKQAYDP